jgi:P-type Cu2+ transporter
VMAGSSVLVVLNSLRLERLSEPDPSQLAEQMSSAATARRFGVPIALGAATEKG